MKLFMATLQIVVFWIIIISFIVYIIYSAYKLKRTMNYNTQISFIEGCLLHWIVSERNYYIIENAFHELDKYNVDKIRTTEARNKFENKYALFINDYKNNIRL